MSTAREQILATTCALLEEQGYHGTSLTQILQVSNAPKGSLYYYFPDGKEGLACAAIERSGQIIAERIRESLALHADPSESVRAFVLFIADQLEASGSRFGGPLTTIAMETATTNERLNHACRAAYGRLQAVFAEKLVAAGLASADALELAQFITSTIEGGIILSRTRHSGEPLRVVARQVYILLQRQNQT